MKTANYFIVCAFIGVLSFLNVANAKIKSEPEKTEDSKVNADGPYILQLPDGKYRIISVNEEGQLKDSIYDVLPRDFSLPIVSHSGKHRFEVRLHSILRPAWKYEKPEKLFVLSDPHGNLDCFVSVLRGNNIINDKYEWVYGKNHLMIIGDVFDRGKDVLPIFWLIYKLEKEAQDAGGHVSFLLGNHEPMILAGDLRYMDKMYKDLAERLNINYEELVGKDSELGRWLGTRNTIEVIGRDLFVHAGLSKAFMEKDLSIPLVNEEMSNALFMNNVGRKEYSPLANFLYGNQGPIWYRGMVRNDEKYFPLHQDDLAQLLSLYSVDRIIVGHTIFPDVITLYNGRVIAVNVDNKKNFEHTLGRGILVEGAKTYVVNDKGIMSIIK